MTQQVQLDELGSTFQTAWNLLVRNPLIVVPGLVIGIAAVIVVVVTALTLVGSVMLAAASQNTGLGVATVLGALAVGFVLVVLVGAVQAAFTTGMAAKAWETGTATLADGWATCTARFGDLVYAMFLLTLVFVVALLLAPVTIGLSLLAYFAFFLYVYPAVVVGGDRGGAALGESYRLALRNFWPTVGIAAIVLCVGFIAGGIGGEISRSQLFAGTIAGSIIEQAAVAYAILVVVGEYRKLRGSAPSEAAAAPPPSGQPAP